MYQLMTVLGTISRVLRAALFVVGVLTLIIALAAWAVRTRRINPFSGFARAIRRVTDPLLAPVEKRLVLGGQRVANAPWWLLGIVVVGGLLLIAAFDFIAQQILFLSSASSEGPRAILYVLVSWTFGLLQLALLVRVLSSWIAISRYNPVIRLAYGLTEWFLAPLRGIIPTVGMFDITPLVAWFLLRLVSGAVLSMIR